MYRILTCWFAFIIISTTFVIAQDEDDEPLPPPKHSLATKIGGAIGFTQGYLFLNLDPINQIMRKENLAEFDSRGLFMLGGQGYAYVMFVPNLRVGYINMGGHMRSRTLDPSTKIVREVELSVGYSGATFDYTIPVAPRVDVSLGMLLGAGNMDLNFTRNNGLPQQWDSTWNNFGANTPVDNYSGKLSGSFFIYQPSLNVEVAVLRWLGVRAGVSYLGMSGNNWKRDDKYDLFGVPDEVSGKGWMFNSGIFVGTFVF